MTTDKNRKARNTADFKRQRARLLADDPTCTICGAEANTIDHIRPTDTFDNPLDANHPDNLRVLCKSCNSRLGARYVNAKTSGRLPQIDHTERSDFLSEKSFLPPLNAISVSDPYFARLSQDQVQNTQHLPRLRTNTQGGRDVYMGALEELAERVLGAKLMEWQRVVLRDQLLVGDDGRLLFRQSVTSVARQNGKSFALRCLLLFWLIEMPRIRGQEQMVLTTAHRLDLASELFNSLAPLLEEQFDAKVIYSYGRQSVTMPAVGDYPGARWLVRAATPSAGHGLSCDLVIVDELFGCSPEAIDDALVPTMRARKDPLMSCWSTAGTVDESVVFRRMREKGMAEIATGERSRLYYAEYSPPSHLDPMSPEAWVFSNPALGTTLEMETIQEEAKGANQASFLRASVNVWVTGTRSWLDQGLFVGLRADQDLPVEGGVLSIESSADDNRFVAVRAVADGDKVLATVEFITDNLRDLWKKLEEAREAHKGLSIACGAALDVHLPPAVKGNAVLVGQREIQKWTTIVRSMIMSGQVLHTGEEILVEQVNRAVLVKHQGQLSISSARSPGPVELCRALIWSVAMAGKPKATTKAAFAFSD
jgi:hypothetical protein